MNSIDWLDIYWFIKKIEDFFDANPAEISDSLSVESFKQVGSAAVLAGENPVSCPITSNICCLL